MSNFWEQNLLSPSLGGIEFPIDDRQVGLGRNFARSVYPYRNGQGVEDLGRKVYQFTLKVPLFRGVSEAHYPETYLSLLRIIEDDELRGEVEYVDPEFGPLDVKLVDYNWTTAADRRDGGVLTIQLEERGFEESILATLSHFAGSGPSRAAQHAADADFEIAQTGERPGFSLTETWQSFQAMLDQGALAADELAARIDEVYFVAEKVITFSAVNELQRFSLYNSVVDFLGAAEDVVEDVKTRDGSRGRRAVEVLLPVAMDMYQVAERYLGDADRAEEVAYHNPGNPLGYPQGQRITVPAA